MPKRIIQLLSSAFALAFLPSYSTAASDQMVINHTMTTLDGESVDLAEKYAGKVILFVNVASRCGFTSQYGPLQELHDKYKDQGLAIVGVPCNQFMGQEPGSSEEIATFCQKNYGVTFDMLSKVNVKGDDKCPLYVDLVGASESGKEVSWNFNKFLVSREGKLISRYGSRVKPDSEQLTDAIEAALAAE